MKGKPRCIYCLSDSNPFNREHALHAAFGKFKGNEFVMHNLVCHACNQHFGDTIDRALTRDSVEALLRFQLRLKSPSKAREIPYSRVILTVNQPGPWFGAQFEFASDPLGMALIPTPLAQIAIRRKSESDWEWILEQNLSALSLKDYQGALPDSLKVKILGPKKSDTERLAQKLQNLGINLPISKPIDCSVVENGTIDTQIRAQVDSTIFRAIAKIAFNYVACVHGAEFILRSDFDYLRNYIRHDVRCSWPFVVPTNDPILSLDSQRYRQTIGHLITFDWNLSQRGLLVQVSLFNQMTYRVLFCMHYTGLWSDSMRIGHHFDFEDGAITRLASAPSWLVLKVG